jgi:ribonuclease HII
MNISYKNNCIEIGVDEAGRGPIFGRVYAGACIWSDDDINLSGISIIKDSKKYKNETERMKAYDFIIDNSLSWGCGYSEVEEIDKINILNATINAMHRAIIDTYIYPDNIIVDGTQFKEIPIIYNKGSYEYTTIIDGDNKYYNIAGASIIAKVKHDMYISELLAKYPQLKIYDLEKNKGYGTKNHITAINTHGITKLHRKSFKCNTSLIINDLI